MDKTLWFHTASVGEFNTIKPILRELVNGYRIVLTYFSPRARDYLQKQSVYYHILERLPLDTPLTVSLFERRIKPHVLFIVEREFWPSLLFFTKVRKVLLNAYAKGGIYERLMSKRFDLIIARSERDRERFESYGCKKVITCGNLKFLFEKRESKELNIEKGDFRFFVAGSTHRGEEEILLKAFRKLKSYFPKIRLLIAPRHISRAKEIQQMATGLRCSLRSYQGRDWDILIIDTLGELFDMYALADIAFVGGTLLPVGGHNLLEPAYHGKPVLFGPFTEKVRDMAEYLLQKGAGFLVRDENDIFRVVKDLLTGKGRFNKANINEESERIRSCYLDSIRNVL